MFNFSRVHFRQLRQKIEHGAASPKLILTKPGVGCRLSGIRYAVSVRHAEAESKHYEC
jgi:hypothetical protein